MKHLTSFKILMLFIFVLVSNVDYAQNVKNTKPPLTLYTNESGAFVYDTVVNVSGVSKAELYKRAKDWVLSTIRTSDKTVIFDDKDSSEIRTDATIIFSKFPTLTINFKLQISFKENKCRIVYGSFISNIIGNGTISQSPFEKITGYTRGTVDKINNEFDVQFPIFNNSLIKSLYKGNNSNW